jgi:hypothetical protein
MSGSGYSLPRAATMHAEEPRQMPGQTPTRQELYQRAMDAFAAASALSAARPLPGTKLWNDWQMLVKAALKANEDYVRSLRRPR